MDPWPLLDANFRFYDTYKVPFGMEIDAYDIEKLPLIDAPVSLASANADIVYNAADDASAYDGT